MSDLGFSTTGEIIYAQLVIFESRQVTEGRLRIIAIPVHDIYFSAGNMCEAASFYLLRNGKQSTPKKKR